MGKEMTFITIAITGVVFYLIGKRVANQQAIATINQLMVQTINDNATGAPIAAQVSRELGIQL